jgi:hypothetical protein
MAGSWSMFGVVAGVHACACCSYGISSWNMQHKLCSEAKCKRTVAGRNLMNKTAFLMSHNICVQYIERNIKIHQKKTGYSVTDVRNCGVKMCSLWIMSVSVWLMSYLRDSSNYCIFPDAYSYPTFRAFLSDIPRTLTRYSAHSGPTFRAHLPDL